MTVLGETIVMVLVYKEDNVTSLIFLGGKHPEIVGFHLDVHEPIPFQFCVFAVTIQLNCLVSLSATITFI